MKTKKAFDLCKKRSSIATFFFEDAQWLMTDIAAYSIAELPQLCEDSICKIYDISDKQREKIHFRIGVDVPEIVGRGDCDTAETEAKPMNIGIELPGIGLCCPFMTEQGVVFIQSAFLSPFSDVPESEIMFFSRTGSNGAQYIAVKVGLFLYAIITPVIATDDIVESLYKLYREAKLAMENRALKEREENE